MGQISLAISEAARASSLEEIGASAFPALAAALGACPAFLAESSGDFVEADAIAGEAREELSGYLRRFASEDPLIRVAVAVSRPVSVLESHVDARTVRASRAYNEFHRAHDFEHHMIFRFLGERLTSPHALVMGFTRGRRLPAFGAREIRIAELVLPALQGAAQRIVTAGFRPVRELSRVADERGLTRAEAHVLSILLRGSSNREIARSLSISIDTVKTHLQRIFRKLGVASRAQALATMRDAGYASEAKRANGASDLTSGRR
jgi:DNA-binding CsgD family transcriptional regulator